MITVKHLTKKFELRLDHEMNVNPFEDLSFQVSKGQFMGIAGPSGIGKSTILKCIYRTYLPTSGEILYDSAKYGTIDLVTASEREMFHLRKEEISYVSQFLRVIPRVSAVDVVAERLLPAGVSLQDARAQAEKMLERLNIPRKLYQGFPATFSGGEQQRINLARAFIVRPRMMILDEPTASLDKLTKASVVEILQEMKAHGTTMMGVFHDWDVMEQVSDQILDLKAIIEKRGDVVYG
jgi:alpha-D-ribose 1-methylphosphonate 5-triphosphate synthase subunit PhnL